MPGDRPLAVCVGGPWDGVAVVGGKRLGRFAWITAQGRTHDNPGTEKRRVERYLYRAEKWGSRVAFVYAANRWFRCRGCGAFHRSVEGGGEKPNCHLCDTVN